MAGKKLLVADDSLTIQKVIRLALSSEGYEIQAISDGAEAIQHISVFRPDLVLIDVSLPTRSAFEIKREVNQMEDLENSKFILMSSAFEKIDEEQAKEVLFHGRLTKPFDPAHLRQVLQEVLSTGQKASGNKTGSRSAIPKPTSAGLQAQAPLAPPQQLPDEQPANSPNLTMEGISIHLDPPTDFPAEPEQPANAISLDFEESPEESTPPPLPTSNESPGLDSRDEIKHLTESTIRMSGLDDFDWTINDSSLRPPAAIADDGGSSFQMVPQFSQEQSPDPVKRTHRQAASGTNPKLSRPQPSIPQQPQIPLPVHSPAMPSSEEIEEVVRKQVEKTLAEMARRILPDVCERVIKAEINRLLNEKI